VVQNAIHPRGHRLKVREFSTLDDEIGTKLGDSGMAPLIRAVLSKLIGDEEASKIEIIANDVQIEENGHWEIKYRHPERSVRIPYPCSPACPTARLRTIH
jgi:hypothetical protein